MIFLNALPLTIFSVIATIFFFGLIRVLWNQRSLNPIRSWLFLAVGLIGWAMEAADAARTFRSGVHALTDLQFCGVVFIIASFVLLWNGLKRCSHA